MADLLITLVALVPVVLALLAAVAPAKSAWIRPALMPSVLMQLTLAAALGIRPFLFGYLFGGVPPRTLGSEEIQGFTGAITGLGLPFGLAFFAALTAAASAVASSRSKSLKHGFGWAAIAVGAFCVDRAHAAVVATVANEPLESGIDTAALVDTVDAAWMPWLIPAAIAFLAAFPLMMWVGWWTRERWSGYALPGLMALGVGLSVGITAVSFSTGVQLGEFTEPIGGKTDAITPDISATILFTNAWAMMMLAALLATIIAVLRMLAARKRQVRSSADLLAALAWLPLAFTIWAAAAVVNSPFWKSNQWAIDGLDSSLEIEHEGYLFRLIEQSLNSYLPLIANGAALTILLFCLAGPLGPSRRSDRPSTAA
jgi:hypothetical protein